MKKLLHIINLFLLSFYVQQSTALSFDPPLIFPIPQELEYNDEDFILNENTIILVPQYPSKNDIKLARLLTRELSIKHSIAVNTVHVTKIPSANNNYIVMGNKYNPLVSEYCKNNNIYLEVDNLEKEGYVFNSNNKIILIAGYDDEGTFYGLQSFRQLLKQKEKKILVPGIKVRDWPYKSFRGIRTYCPGNENMQFFKRFLKDFVALYKYNKVVLGISEFMISDKHPELQASWQELIKEMNYSRRARSKGPNLETQTGFPAGMETLLGLDKNELVDIVEYADNLNIEIIPEIRTLTHTYYFCASHRELAEIQDAEWPDNWCPSNPKSTELWIDIVDEFLDALNSKMVHVGRDEWRMPVDACPLCRGKDYRELFAQDLNKIYNYLKTKNIKTGMWADHLLKDVRSAGLRDRTSPSGHKYKIPGALSDEQIGELIPKDILMFNWSWNHAGGENNDIALERFGFKQVFGNLTPQIENWSRRSSRHSVIGGAPSIWGATREFEIGKDVIFDLLGCSNLLWSKHWPKNDSLLHIAQSLMPQVKQNLSGVSFPSQNNNKISTIDIAKFYNTSYKISGMEQFEGINSGKISVGKKLFYLSPPKNTNKFAAVVGTEGDEKCGLPSAVKGIKINKDVNSIIFLHACLNSARNTGTYNCDYNTPGTADLLGWYEIIYEDGFIETIPIIYGVNILEYTFNSGNYCYEGEAIKCTRNDNKSPVTFFAFEWINPRLGTTVSEVNLKGTKGFSLCPGSLIKNNGIVLKALSIVEKREHRELLF